MLRYLFIISLGFISLATSAQNKVFHTKFNNGQAQDISGNNFHGVLYGSPAACPGMAGVANTALYFDGINDYVLLPSDTAFNLTKWTLHAIVKPQGFNSTTCQANGIIWHDLQMSDQFYGMDICDNYYDNDCLYDSQMEAFGGLAAGTAPHPDFESPWYTTNGYVAANEWYCVVLTFDGSLMNLFVNGDLVESGPYPAVYNYTSASPTYIGNGPQLGYHYWFKGAIDEVSIWDDAVTLAQVTGGTCDSFIALSTKQHTTATAKLDIYPSPATATLNLEVSKDWQGSNWELLNVTGQVLTTGIIKNELEVVDVSSLSPGIYMIKARNATGTETKKFIKQ